MRRPVRKREAQIETREQDHRELGKLANEEPLAKWVTIVRVCHHAKQAGVTVQKRWTSESRRPTSFRRGAGVDARSTVRRVPRAPNTPATPPCLVPLPGCCCRRLPTSTGPSLMCTGRTPPRRLCCHNALCSLTCRYRHPRRTDEETFYTGVKRPFRPQPPHGLHP